MKQVPSIVVSKPIWYSERNKNFFNNFIFFIINHNVMLSLFQCNKRSSLVSLNIIKLIAVLNRIFQIFSDIVSDIFKYDLILL